MSTFEINIQRKSANHWPIVVEHNRPGELLSSRSEGILELTEEDFQKLTSLLGQPQEYGTFLGKALFKEEIRDAFVSALRDSEEPVRVLLFIEAEDKEIRTLRWERLCGNIDDGWHLLSLEQRTPYSLYIPAITDRRFPPIGRTDLRALILVASPSEIEKYKLDSFDVEAAVSGVRQSLGEIPCDVLATVEGAIGEPTLDELCKHLTDRSTQYTFLHFVSHSRVIDSGETVLYWAKEDNKVDPVTGTRLIERLRSLKGAKGLPHFTFLSTCESASPEAEAALGGLAQRLVRDLGIPAVVAMTEKVTVKTALALAENFYRQLRQSGEVDSALHEALAGLAERGDVTVPALFSRLGGRPLFTDKLDRELTNAQIQYGLEQLERLLSERAPALRQRLQELAQKLGNSLEANITALSKQARYERAQVLQQVNTLCQEIIDISFNALALGQQPAAYNPRCPFVGLYPFREHREFFFGREQLITQLQAKLTEHNFLAVLGASGSGKSSVVLGGLIPALQKQQPNLVLSYLTPSNKPLATLQATLAKVENKSTILVIDQFEELFTLCADETERRAFIEQVLRLTQQQKVVITMRSDFCRECAPYPDLKKLIAARQKLIKPMHPGELRKAMDMQAAQVGLRFEAGLSNSILDHVKDQPGAMPLLQHALVQLWKGRHGRWLPSQEYEAMGGVKKAIAQIADDVYNTLSLPEQAQVENIFTRLTRLDDSSLQGQKRRDKRQRVGFDELVPSGESVAQIKELVNRLATEGARLVVISVDESTNRAEVEVAHEALIHHWPRLVSWLDENRTNLQLRETIRQAALAWEGQKKDDNYLVHRGGRLDDAQVLTKQAGFLNQLEIDYVNACVQFRLHLAQKKLARRRREIRTPWVVATGAVVAFIVSFTFGLVAWGQKQEAQRQKQEAQISKAEVISQFSLSLLNSHQELKTLVEGIKAGKILTEQKVTQPQIQPLALAIGALRKAVDGREQRNIVEHQNYVTALQKAVDGVQQRNIVEYQNYVTALRKAVDGVQQRNIVEHQNQNYVPSVPSIVFSLDGKTTAITNDDNTLKFWDLGEQLPSFTADQYFLSSKVFSLEDKTPASDDNTVKVSDLAGRELATFTGHENRVNSVVFSPDGRIIATASDDKTVKLWDLTGKELATFTGHENRVNSVVFSPDGQTIATASDDKTVKLWDLTGRELATFIGHEDRVTSVVFSPDGKTIATASDDKTVKLWDLTGRELATFKGHENRVNKLIQNQP